MSYVKVFEITEKGYQWWPIVLPLCFSLVFYAIGRKKPHRSERLSSYSLAAVGLILALLITALTYPAYGSLQSSYLRGDFAVVEGPVEDFKPMPYEGHRHESFEVRGVRFSYSDYELSPGFNNTTAHGGPIQEGLWVRIAYHDDPFRGTGRVILRLEIAGSGASHKNR